MTKRGKIAVVLAAGAVLLLAGAAHALINPFFTPVDLVENAEFILLLKMNPSTDNKRATCEIVRYVKGEKKAPKKAPIFDFTITPRKDHAKKAMRVIAALGDRPALLFCGEGEKEEPISMLHFNGKWVSLDPSPDEEGVWEMDAYDDHMEATWAGGTDMLLKISDLLVEYPDTDVPVESGVAWSDAIKLEEVEGKVSGMQAVDLDGKGKLSLYIACNAGDRLLKYDGKNFASQTLGTKSRAATWADFNADGRLDLASWDGKVLSVSSQGADGKLGAAKAVAGAPEGDCLGLAALDAGVAGRPGLLWSGKAGPVLLAPGKDGAFTAAKLDLGGADFSKLGTPGACLVADLDEDGFADVFQPGQKSSLFFKGKGKGAFAAAAACPMDMGEGRVGTFLGDWDMDGRLDIFCSADDLCRLWHNRKGLKFESTLGISGEIAYISKPGSFGGNTCDVNNDGLQDVFLFYTANPDTGPQFFFTRGFRSFGHGHSIDIVEQNILDESREGQKYAVAADFTGDCAQDMAVILANGDFYIYPRDAQYETPMAIRVVLPLGGPVTGPVKVTAWNDRRCLGAWNVVAGTAEAFIGQIEPGEITLKWRLPGGEEQKKVVNLDDKPVTVVIK